MFFDKYSDENRHFICGIPCLSLHHTNVVLLMYFRCRHQVALSFLSARANFNCDVIITSVSRFAQCSALPVPPLLLAKRRRQWPSITSALGQCIVLSGDPVPDL